MHTHLPHFTHRHTNTPFRYLLWSKLSHLVKGQKFEQEVWAPNKAVKTVWQPGYTGDLQQCPFSFFLRIALFLIEVRKLKCEMWACTRCGKGCMTFTILTLMKCYTQLLCPLHNSCNVPARHGEICTFFSSTPFCYLKIMLASFTCTVLLDLLAFVLSCILFLLCFPSLLTLPSWSASSFQPAVSFHIWLSWSEVRYNRLLPPGFAFNLPFSHSFSPPSASSHPP